MKLNELLQIQLIRNEYSKLNESELEELREEINNIEGCGYAVTSTTSLENLMKAFLDPRLEQHAALDAEKKDMNAWDNYKICRINILKVIYTHIKKKIEKVKK